MPLIRNPFARKHEPAPVVAPAEAASTGAATPTTTDAAKGGEDESQQIPANGHDVEAQGTTTTANNAKSASGSKPVNIVKTSGKDEPDVYKLGVVSDGVYLPPSPPTEKRGSKVWRRSTSSQTVKSRDSTTEGEPFTISRESFDSYRRSFDISARLPVTDYGKERRSLDVRLRGPNSGSTYTPPRTARASESNMRPTVESIFEEVSLADEHHQPARRRGLLSKLVGHSEEPGNEKRQTLGARLRGKGNVVGEAELLRIDRERQAKAAAAAGAGPAGPTDGTDVQ
ncbi:hypothetical protein BJ508DRAFT_167229 [Ascobolus immersus RN42]|uniref:Uncharacterized protein n=1 Tax=Ascobolus immersus RN42 TaxID=1160509 RepID=A0A3N4IM17_ASCIM|nr:hypothetical protein BJ508DRAFT_167229 [Ascobolus immersus RN42]